MSSAIEILKDMISYRKKGIDEFIELHKTGGESILEIEIRTLKKALLALESQSSRVGQVAFLHQENQLLKKENARLKRVDRFVVEVFNRLKERAEFDRARAETDLKILDKWKKNYLELVK